MQGRLLDVNVLIALVVEEHVYHARALAWAASVERFALCPIVEGSLVRFLVRAGESAATASAVLEALYQTERCEFWPDSVSYRNVDLAHVVGHQQVTDAYLASLAVAHDARLVTFDKALAAALPQAVQVIS